MKKKFAAFLAALMACTLLAGCGSSASSSTAEAESSVESSTESSETSSTEGTTDSSEIKLAEAGTLTMGTNAAFPPYEYYDGDTIVGIDAEIAAAVAEKLGLELKIVDMDFSSLITAVQSGKIDCSLAGMTVNEERLKNVDFSNTYSTGVQVVIVPEDSDIESVDDLAGHLIGVQESTTGHIYCADDFGEENVIAYTTGPIAVQSLVQGKVDCVVIDKQPALSFVEANEGLKILDTEYVVEDYAAAISKNNPALLAGFNQALEELTADGTIDAILAKYINDED